MLVRAPSQPGDWACPKKTTQGDSQPSTFGCGCGCMDQYTSATAVWYSKPCCRRLQAAARVTCGGTVLQNSCDCDADVDLESVKNILSCSLAPRAPKEARGQSIEKVRAYTSSKSTPVIPSPPGIALGSRSDHRQKPVYVWKRCYGGEVMLDM